MLLSRARKQLIHFRKIRLGADYTWIGVLRQSCLSATFRQCRRDPCASLPLSGASELSLGRGKSILQVGTFLIYFYFLKNFGIFSTPFHMSRILFIFLRLSDNTLSLNYSFNNSEIPRRKLRLDIFAFNAFSLLSTTLLHFYPIP